MKTLTESLEEYLALQKEMSKTIDQYNGLMKQYINLMKEFIKLKEHDVNLQIHLKKLTLPRLN